VNVAPNGGLGAVKKLSPWEALPRPPRGVLSMNAQARLGANSSARFSSFSLESPRSGE